MAWRRVALLLLLAAGACGQARELLQTGNARCPDGCDLSGGCVRDTTTGGYRCIRCLQGLTVLRDSGRCGCSRGKYATSAAGVASDDCADCEVGLYCPGGEYNKTSISPARVDCPGQPTQMTTLGTRATSVQQCVNQAGFSYAWNTSLQAPAATPCPGDTYTAGLRKQPSCTPCGPGLSTWSPVGGTSATDCSLKAGYYLRTPGVAALCPKGEYAPGRNLATRCTRCPDGVTTPTEGAESVLNCTVLLPGYQATANTGSLVNATQPCSQDSYCPGGTLTAIGTANGAVRCFDGLWTKSFGAVAENECLVPPGYSKNATAIAPCANGFYREGWVFVGNAAELPCASCGDGYQSSPTEALERWDAANAPAAAALVAGAKGSCFIRRGEGSYQTTANTFYVVSCSGNNYGAVNASYGQGINPCRDCPNGMRTIAGANYSAISGLLSGPTDHFRDAATGGFYDPRACLTLPGYGYNGRVATRCQQGYWNSGWNHDSCTKCPYGLTTKDPSAAGFDVAQDQNELSDCHIAPGFGYEDGVVKVCPVGKFNSEVRLSDVGNNQSCTPCPAGLTTTEEGASSPANSSCNVCAPGYGGASFVDCYIGKTCGGVNGANYGPWGRSPTTFACTPCPTMATGSGGFTFDFAQSTNNYAPGSVARPGATSVSDCLAEFTQVEDNVWSLPSNLTATPDAADSLEGCTAACAEDADCMFVTFNYASDSCSLFLAPFGTDMFVGYKTSPAGDVVETSAVQKAALASGRYTWWSTATFELGTETGAAQASATVDNCQKACNLEPTCAAVVMSGLSGTSDSATGSCSMRKGSTLVDTGLRSLVRAVSTQLSLATAANATRV